MRTSLGDEVPCASKNACSVGQLFLTYVPSHKSFSTEPQNIYVGLWEDSQPLVMRTMQVHSMPGFVALF